MRPQIPAGNVQPVECFPPLLGSSATVLILGSMPGMASLAAGQYYAHPRNAFWHIMSDIYGIDASHSYASRVKALTSHGVAVWDVLKSCTRQGSLDACIIANSMIVNDFRALFGQCGAIGKIVFNGTTAQQTYIRHVLPTLEAKHAAIPAVRLPSTSPAHAGLAFEVKLQVWREALRV